MGTRIAPLLFAALTAGSCVRSTHADEPVALIKVPAKARQAAVKLAPGVRFTKALYDRSNKYYKLRGTDPTGRNVHVLSDDRAEFVQVAVSAPVAMKNVPAAVIETRRKAAHAAERFRFMATQVVRTEQFTAGVSAATVLFEFVGTNAQGTPMRQVVRDDGTNIGLSHARE